LRIVFDKNVPVGVRRFLSKHWVGIHSFEAGDLLDVGSPCWSGAPFYQSLGAHWPLQRISITRSPASRQASTPGHNAFERCEQGLRAAIAEPNPDQLDLGLGLAGEVKKIFVFGDDDAPLFRRVSTNLRIGRLSQTDLKNVLAIETPLTKVVGKRPWKLIIHQELHEVCKTAWSVW
jgi:hypothetical protein